MKILLIAGHGDGDPGACSNGYTEAVLVRELATFVKQKLSPYATVEIFNTNKNMYKYLKSGGNFDFSPYDYILELHFNAGGGYGTEILVHTNQQGISVEQKIVDKIETLGFCNRGVKRRSDLQNMNRIFKSGKDYALLETCFIDNVSDMGRYNVTHVAEAIADGIVEGFGLAINSCPQEIVSVNDIVWDLHYHGIISNKELWLKKLNEDINSYWLARKMVNYLRGFRY